MNIGHAKIRYTALALIAAVLAAHLLGTNWPEDS